MKRPHFELVVICDNGARCTGGIFSMQAQGFAVVTEGGEAAAEAQLTERGWYLSETLDICPDCVQKAQRP